MVRLVGLVLAIEEQILNLPIFVDVFTTMKIQLMEMLVKISQRVSCVSFLG